MKLTEVANIDTAEVKTIGQYIQAQNLTQYIDNDGVMMEDLGPFKQPNTINSWDGCPHVFKDRYELNLAGTKMTSIEGMNIESVDYLKLTSGECFRSYQGIHQKVGRTRILWLQPATHMLEVILIPDLHRVQVQQRGWAICLSINQAQSLSDILTRHLDEKDINACQEELIQAGFARFADI